MSHVRQQLRDAVASVLTGLTTTGTRVFINRVYPADVSDCPCLIVRSDGDDVEAQTIHQPYLQVRRTRIQVEAYAEGVDEFDDEIDTICQEVETAIANASSSFVKGMYLRGTRIDFDQGEQPIGRTTMVFTKDLYTQSNAPQTAL